MKSSKLIPAHESKHNEISPGELSRFRLPQLPKSQQKAKRPQVKVTSRLDSTPTKYDQLVEEILELQNCVSKKYGKSIRIDSLRKMQKSIYSLNNDLLMINRKSSMKTSKEIVKSTSSSDCEEKNAPTEQLSKWSKRIIFKKRPEMKQKNLVVVNFEGVLGEVFKDNIWTDKEPKLHLRKGCIKGLKLLITHFQVCLFFSEETPSFKILNYFSQKKLKFDAVYISQNSKMWEKKSSGTLKKPFKYSDHIQDYTQVAKDFLFESQELEKILILSSLWLETCESGVSTVVRNFHSIPQYFCKSVPLLKNEDNLLPITLAVPDPRVQNEGDSFESIASVILALTKWSSASDEPSWIDSFAQIRESPSLNCTAFETSAYQFSIKKQKIRISKGDVGVNQEEPGHCICQHDLKAMCMCLRHGKCTVRQKLKAYKLLNKPYPSSLVKNKFIVFKPTKPVPYKMIHAF